MLKHKSGINHMSGTAPRKFDSSSRKTAAASDLKTAAAAVAAVAAAAVLIDIAIIPGVVIGGASVLAPKYLRHWIRLPRRRSASLGTPERRLAKLAIPPVIQPAEERQKAALPTLAAVLPNLAIERAAAKTITFRIIVTSLDFGANYFVIGEIATAAGLSGFSLLAGPFFYFVHETLWTYFGASAKRGIGRWGATVELPLALPFASGASDSSASQTGLTVNLALAKTITFRTFATTMDFATNYVVVGEIATAAALSAFGFFLGPFIYLGHEMVWDRYSPPKPRDTSLPEQIILSRAS